MFDNSKDQIKLRMEMENMSKRQLPEQRADISRRPPMGLQRSEKIQHRRGSHMCCLIILGLFNFIIQIKNKC